jgi:CrcB protein
MRLAGRSGIEWPAGYRLMASTDCFRAGVGAFFVAENGSREAGSGEREVTAFVLIGIGGVLGANARFVISTWAAGRWGTAFPFGTLIVNVSGCFLMGAFLQLVADHFGDSEPARFLLATGFLGAYTTFSTFAYETVALGRQQNHLPAVLNLIGSAAIGVAAAASGILLMSQIKW